MKKFLLLALIISTHLFSQSAESTNSINASSILESYKATDVDQVAAMDLMEPSIVKWSNNDLILATRGEFISKYTKERMVTAYTINLKNCNISVGKASIPGKQIPSSAFSLKFTSKIPGAIKYELNLNKMNSHSVEFLCIGSSSSNEFKQLLKYLKSFSIKTK